MSFMHRAKEWWDRRPLGILIGFAVATLGAFALVWGLFSGDPPIPEIVEILRAADAVPSPVQLVGLALLVLAIGGQIALLVAVLLKHRTEERRLHEDLSVVVMALREIAEPSDLQVEWQRREASLREERTAEEEQRKQLRETANLRALRASEIGRKVSDLPRGTYCFVDTLGLVDYPRIPQSHMGLVFGGDLNFAAKLRFAVTQKRLLLFRKLLEVHLPHSGEAFIVGFAPDLDATEIESGKASRARLFLSRAAHAPVAVRVDAECIGRAVEYPTDPPHLDLQLTPPENPPPTKSGS